MRFGRASGATLLVLGLLVAAASACNLLTGVGDLGIDDGAIAPIDRDARADDDASITLDGSADGSTMDAGAAGASTVAFLMGTSGDAGQLAQPGTISLNGGTPKAIGCATSTAYEAAFQMSPPAGGSSDVQNGPYRLGNLSSRAFGSTFVYLDATQVGGDNSPVLLVANETTDCAANPPKRIDRNAGANTLLFFPRFSQNGARLAYLEVSQSFEGRLLATSPTGGAPNVVRSGAPVDAGSGGQIWITPPAWNGDEIIWVEAGPMGAYLPLTVMHAKDDGREATMAQPLSTCDRYIEQIEIFSRNGQVLAATVSSKAMWSQSNTSSSIVVHPLSQGCATGKPLSNETTPGTVARDVAVSPDGNFIAFASNIDTPAASRTSSSPMNIWIVDSSGTSAPIRCSSPVNAALDEVGPQWLANGTKLVWMRASHDQNSRESIWGADVANGVCSNVRPLLDDEVGGTRYLVQTNAGMTCSVDAVGASRMRGSRGAAFVGFAGGIAMAIRRRRERTCSSSR